MQWNMHTRIYKNDQVGRIYDNLECGEATGADGIAIKVWKCVEKMHLTKNAYYNSSPWPNISNTKLSKSVAWNKIKISESQEYKYYFPSH